MPPTVNVTGSWSGSWFSKVVAASGNFEMFVNQNFADVDGSGDLSGSSCFFGGDISGTVSGNVLSGTLTAGANSVSYVLTVIGSTMNGTYSVTEGDCDEDQGFLTASLVSPPLTEEEGAFGVTQQIIVWPAQEDIEMIIHVIRAVEHGPMKVRQP